MQRRQPALCREPSVGGDSREDAARLVGFQAPDFLFLDVPLAALRGASRSFRAPARLRSALAASGSAANFAAVRTDAIAAELCLFRGRDDARQDHYEKEHDGSCTRMGVVIR